MSNRRVSFFLYTQKNKKNTENRSIRQITFLGLYCFVYVYRIPIKADEDERLITAKAFYYNILYTASMTKGGILKKRLIFFSQNIEFYHMEHRVR